MTTAPSNPLVDAGLAPAAPPVIGVTIPAKLHPPLDVSRIKNENGVKELVKKLLDAHGWFHFAVPANGMGSSGVHDRLALKDGVFISLELKYKYNKPSTLQKAFAAQVLANDCFAFCVNEKNIDHLAWWLESFEIAKQCQIAGRDVPSEHGSRMLNAISVLTDPFAE